MANFKITLLSEDKHLTAHDKKMIDTLLTAGKMQAYSPKKRLDILEGKGKNKDGSQWLKICIREKCFSQSDVSFVWNPTTYEILAKPQ